MLTQLTHFRTLSGGDAGIGRDAACHFEMQMQPRRMVMLVEPQSPHHARQGRQQAAFDGSQRAQGVVLVGHGRCRHLRAQFPENLAHWLGIEG
ncbi:hypothetical protein [Noviherbaspirillum soli]|uniref:hypothetical protein n=1 Tax=Noviherbaspirillum soli TaxID=1064518 RepID=UPI00188A6DAE|nr:hypothetical protein [Noviherbaspirillum soli]